MLLNNNDLYKGEWKNDKKEGNLQYNITMEERNNNI